MREWLPLGLPSLSLLGWITLLFLFRLTLANVVIPPWQNPDEPTHVAFVRMLATSGDRGGSTVPSDVIQSEILRSMAEHSWWEAYRERAPSPLPSTLNEVPAHLNLSAAALPSYYFYYRLAALYSRLIGADGLMDQYQALRALSGLFAVMTLWCAWAGSRLLLGETVAIGSTTILALHPQFLLIGIGVSPDAFVNLCGGVIWWQGASLLNGASWGVASFMMIPVTLAGILAKRAFAPFMVVTPLLLAAGILRGHVGSLSRARLAVPLWRAAAVAAVCCVVALLSLGPLRETLAALMATVLAPWTPRPDSFVQFSLSLIDTAWLAGGWLRFLAPPIWYWTVRFWILVALAGIAWLLWRNSDDTPRLGVVAPMLIVGVQLAAIYVDVYGRGVGPQGRYLFPVIGPAIALLWVGSHALLPRNTWPVVGVSLIGLMAALDVAAWILVLLPAYLI